MCSLKLNTTELVHLKIVKLWSILYSLYFTTIWKYNKFLESEVWSQPPGVHWYFLREVFSLSWAYPLYVHFSSLRMFRTSDYYSYFIPVHSKESNERTEWCAWVNIWVRVGVVLLTLTSLVWQPNWRSIQSSFKIM